MKPLAIADKFQFLVRPLENMRRIQMEKKNTKNALIILLLFLVGALAIMKLGVGKPQDDGPDVLIIEESGTYAVTDKYEKVIVKAAGVVLNDGKVDKIIVTSSAGDGEIILSNIEGKLLVVRGYGDMVINLKENNYFENVELEGYGESLKIINDENSTIEKLTISECRKAVTIVGQVKHLDVLANGARVTATEANFDQISISGKDSIVSVMTESQVKASTITEEAKKSGSKIEFLGQTEEPKEEKPKEEKPKAEKPKEEKPKEEKPKPETPKPVTKATFDKLFYAGKSVGFEKKFYNGVEEVVPGVYNIYLDKSKVHKVFGVKEGFTGTLQMELGGKVLVSSDGNHAFKSSGKFYYFAAVQPGHNTHTKIDPSTLGQLDGSTKTHKAIIRLVK